MSDRIWLLTAALSLAAAAAWKFLPDLEVAHGRPVEWWMLAIAFAVIESLVVHIHFRSQAFTFSMGEIALVVGLVYAQPSDLVLGQVVGSAIAFALRRRQQPMKAAFNTVNAAVNTTVAIALYEWLASSGPPLGWQAWPAFYVAALGAAISNTAFINVAISISEGRLRISELFQANVFGLVVAVTNTSLGLAGVLVVRTEPAGIVLLATVAGTLMASSHAYVSERRHHDNLEFLYESTRALHQSHELETAIGTVLANGCRAFRATAAELILLPPGDEAPVRSSFVQRTAELQAIEPIPASEVRLVRTVSAAITEPSVVNASPEGTSVARYLSRRGYRSAMVATLDGENRRVGVMIIADRMSEVSGFADDDLRLFQTVARNAALSLENDQLEQSIVQLTELELQLSHQAFHDALTGLVNRRRFSEEVAEHLRTADVTTVFYIDLDDFKGVNDHLGHHAGDETLVVTAKRILGCLREHDVAARLGGDEFAVLLSEGADSRTVASRVLDAIRQPITIDGEMARIGASIGVASAPKGSSAEALLRNADAAMYVAKSGSKGAVQHFTPDMFTMIAQRRRLQGELERAIERNEFETYFQPIVDLVTEKPVAAEALVRWHHPERGTLTAGAFIGDAEEWGLTIEIGDIVFRQALAAAQRLTAVNGAPFPITVNLSGRQLSTTKTVPILADALLESDADPRSLVLEITETAVMSDIHANLGRLHELRALGVSLALDDFGTGYSSLGHLREFPIDILKIALEFVRAMRNDSKDEEFLRLIVDMGHLLDMRVIAEGVEHDTQAQALRAMRCDLAQGRLYFDAMPIGELEQVMAATPSSSNAGRA